GPPWWLWLSYLAASEQCSEADQRKDNDERGDRDNLCRNWSLEVAILRQEHRMLLPLTKLLPIRRQDPINLVPVEVLTQVITNPVQSLVFWTAHEQAAMPVHPTGRKCDLVPIPVLNE